MGNLKVEIKGLKTFQGNDFDGFNVNVHINGVNCLRAHNDGNGGCNDYYLNIKQGNEKHNEKVNALVKQWDDHIAKLGKKLVDSQLKNGKTFLIKQDRDTIIEDMIVAIETEKNIKKYQKTGIVVGKPNTDDISYFDLKRSLSNFNKKQLCAYLNTLVKKDCDKNGFIILNTNLPECGILIKNQTEVGKWHCTYTNIQFIKKGKNKLKTFWVENYNETEKSFFLDLGFTETKAPKDQKDFGVNSTLDFKGSGMFGSMNDKEWKEITNAIKDYFNLKTLPIRELELHDLL
jgi:hypothetical protein